MQNISNIQPANRVKEVKEYYFSTKLKEIAKLMNFGSITLEILK